MAGAKILLADDQTLILEALKAFLEPEFEVIGAVSDAPALLTLAAALRPDVILLDIGMTQLNDVDAGPKLKKLLPRSKFIVLTTSEDVHTAAEALRLWASAYLLKKSAGFELIKAVREVLRGNSYVTPKIAQRLEDEFVRDPTWNHGRELTLRQREVLLLLAEGRTMKETAAKLQITPRTVAFHKYKVMEDFGLKSNSALVRFAIRHNALSPTWTSAGSSLGAL